MTKNSVKKLSVLGLVLVAASAVTAAIVPSKGNSDDVRFDQNGTLKQSSGGGANNKTCVATQGTIGVACNVSAVTGTTAAENSSQIDGNSKTTI
ncbi:hypothetical protein [Longitalea luteola]|uniref:hypothetical protein n=1 Tax=Longitalea luteola TaxID=2812563 RepID=UPI001A972699|nr:hypothetical protein [Longitalea luteola]